MTESEIPPGFRVQTYGPPPADFDPLTASESLLHRYGYPPRPDAKSTPESYAQWEQRCLFLREATYVEPAFEIIEGIEQGPRLDSDEEKLWSGCIIPNRGGRYLYIDGDWDVPFLYPPSLGYLGTYACDQWIGVDDGPPRPAPLVQAGTQVEGQATRDHPDGQITQIYAWWGWYPYRYMIKDAQTGQNFPVTHFDRISCEVWLWFHSPVYDDTDPWPSARFTLENKTAGMNTIFTIHPPPPQEVLLPMGRRAEWIVGQPPVPWYALANYDVVHMNGSAGWKPPGTPVSEQVYMDKGELIYMYRDNGTLLSEPRPYPDHRSMRVIWHSEQ